MKRGQVKNILRKLFPDVGKGGKYALNLSQATDLVNAVLSGENGLPPLERAKGLDFSKVEKIVCDIRSLAGGEMVEAYELRMKNGEEFLLEVYSTLDSSNGWDGLHYKFIKLVVVSHDGEPCGEECRDCYFLWEALQRAYMDFIRQNSCK